MKIIIKLINFIGTTNSLFPSNFHKLNFNFPQVNTSVVNNLQLKILSQVNIYNVINSIIKNYSDVTFMFMSQIKLICLHGLCGFFFFSMRV